MADKDKIKSGDANLSTPAKAVHFSSSLAKIAAAAKVGVDPKTPTGKMNFALATQNKPTAPAAAEEPATSQPESLPAPPTVSSISLSAASSVFTPAETVKKSPAAAEDDGQIAQLRQIFMELYLESTEELPFATDIYGGADPTISAHPAETTRMYETVTSNILPINKIDLEREIKRLTKRIEVRQKVHEGATTRYFQAKERAVFLPTDGAAEAAESEHEASNRPGGYTDDTADKRCYRATPPSIKVSKAIEELTTDPNQIQGYTQALKIYSAGVQSNSKKRIDDSYKAIAEILNHGIGAPPGLLGLSPIEDALSRHPEYLGETSDSLGGVTMGGNSSQQISYSDEGTYGTKIERCAQRTRSELETESNEAFRRLSAGEGRELPRSTFGLTEGGYSARTYILPEKFAILVKQRAKFQMRLLRGILYLIDDFLAEHQTSKYKDELLVLKSKLVEIMDRRKYNEVPTGYSKITVISALFADNPFQFAGCNAFASWEHIFRNKNDNRFILQVNAATNQFILGANETPLAALARCKELAKNVRAPPPNINWENLGYKTNEDGGLICLSENAIACRLGIEVNQRAIEFPELRNTFDTSVFEACCEGTMTASRFEAMLQELDAQGVRHTDPNAVEPESSSAEDIGITALGAIHGGKGSGKGGKGKGVKGGPGGKGGAKNPTSSADGNSRGRGKSREPDGRSQRSSSWAPGESTAEIFYERAAKLIGQNFECLAPFAELIQAYFLATKQRDIFKRDSATKKVVIPLRLERDFDWKANEQSLNWNCRRDIYAALCLLRDLFTGGSKSNKSQVLSKVGKHYKDKINPDWSALTAEEFKKKYKPNSSATLASLKGSLQQIQLKGDTLTEFTA
jgi:hypothetical protein